MFRPASPIELSYAIVSSLARRQRAFVGEVAEKVATLERRVMTDNFRSPERLLEDMFLVRHELLTVRTMAAQSHDVYARLAPGATLEQARTEATAVVSRITTATACQYSHRPTAP